MYRCYFFFNDTATTEIYTLSLHDALPIYPGRSRPPRGARACLGGAIRGKWAPWEGGSSAGSAAKQRRSEEHTSELQSRQYLVCRLLLEQIIRTFVQQLAHDPLLLNARMTS